MKKNTLGRSGLQVSEIGFGAWALSSSSYGSISRNDAVGALETYVNGDGNFIDTARGYGDSERVIGDFVEERGIRDKLIICSKIWPNDPDKVKEHLEVSLKTLKTDCIDVLYIHNPPDGEKEMNSLLDLYESFRDQGMARFIGASLKGPAVTEDTVDACRRYVRSGRIDVIQLIFSILRQKNREWFDEAKQAGVGLVARTNLESGFLTGKYHRDNPPVFEEGDQRSRWSEERRDSILEAAEEVKKLTEPCYQKVSQAALRFVMDEPAIDTIIPGAKNPEQAKSNIAVANLPPMDTELRRKLVEKYTGKEDIANP